MRLAVGHEGAAETTVQRVAWLVNALESPLLTLISPDRIRSVRRRGSR